MKQKHLDGIFRYTICALRALNGWQTATNEKEDVETKEKLVLLEFNTQSSWRKHETETGYRTHCVKQSPTENKKKIVPFGLRVRIVL